MMVKRYIVIAALVVIQCTLFEPSRDINDIRDWVNMGEGDERTYRYVVRWFDPDNHDNFIDSIYGNKFITVDSVVEGTIYSTDSVIHNYYITVTWSMYDSTGYIGNDTNVQSYRLEKESYLKDYGNGFDYLLIAPIEIGNYWHDQYTGVNRRISEINATRETEAGVFTDVIVMTESYCADTIGEAWYSPSVGDFIKYIDYGNEYFDYTHNQELIDFKKAQK